MANVLTRIFGSRNQRLLRKFGKLVDRVNALEKQIRALPDERLAALTSGYRSRLTAGETSNALMPEAFATVREVSRRILGMRHFDVQLIGAIALHQGMIIEMATGEGKTLVATLPACLNALTGEGVHVVTVNEYLAARDAAWMAPVYEFLGLTVGVIRKGQSPAEKRAAYACDITYGTNNEFGFDYLRDNLALNPEAKVQRKLAYAIVDEADSVLIDEARTPLIISAPAGQSTQLCAQINELVLKLDRQLEEEGAGDYSVDEKARQLHLTEDGEQRIEALMLHAGLLNEGETLYDAKNIDLVHHLQAGLRAHGLYKKNVDYVVKDGEVVIVDQFTGRAMPGRRWSGGLHQAIEAREAVSVKDENHTLATISIQNYFRMYGKLAGMTGTASTEAFELQQIYGLEVIVIPTHKAVIRNDAADLVYLTQEDKFDAVIKSVFDCHSRGQPVLIGTTSIESSEHLSALLDQNKLPHQILNARHHAREAGIVAQAGQPGAITVATNMAGRGTDIVLGGNLKAELAAAGQLDEAARKRITDDWQKRHQAVIEAGGLHIIGTERHESRRIDNQLRGRAGRQGDPGSSRFFLSTEDKLMRIFGDPNRAKAVLIRAGMRDGQVIESRLLTRQIERAQRKVEAHNFDVRKSLLEYDDVANDQRRVVYDQREALMRAEDIEQLVIRIRKEVVTATIDEFSTAGSVEQRWDIAGLTTALASDYGARLPLREWFDADDHLDQSELRERVIAGLEALYAEKTARIGEPVMRHFEKAVMLRQLDLHWTEHLAAMEYLRQGIHLRGYARKNPMYEYKREAFEMFGLMLDQVKHDAISTLSQVRIRGEQDVEALHQQRQTPARAPRSLVTPPTIKKASLNEPCPCGSGKKYKRCHGTPS